MRALTIVAWLLTLACMAALWTVSFIGWRRTAPLRRGTCRASNAGSAPVTSRATLLPGVAGLLLAIAGATGFVRGSAAAGAVGVAGLLVAAAGFGAQVVGVQTLPEALVIRYRARPTFTLPWTACRSLGPPRWPLGGWRVAGDQGRILMPSDLLGQEHVLDVFVARAGLRYRDGAWVDPVADLRATRDPPR